MANICGEKQKQAFILRQHNIPAITRTFSLVLWPGFYSYELSQSANTFESLFLPVRDSLLNSWVSLCPFCHAERLNRKKCIPLFSSDFEIRTFDFNASIVNTVHLPKLKARYGNQPLIKYHDSRYTMVFVRPVPLFVGSGIFLSQRRRFIPIRLR